MFTVPRFRQFDVVRLAQLHFESARHFFRNRVLELKDVRLVIVEPIGPDRTAIARSQQLNGDAHQLSAALIRPSITTSTSNSRAAVFGSIKRE